MVGKKARYILKALGSSPSFKNYAAEHYEDLFTHDHINDEKRKELHEDWKRFSREIAKLSDLASYQLSAKAVAILDDYKKKKIEAIKSPDHIDWIESDLAAVTECLEELKKEAKKDLKIK